MTNTGSLHRISIEEEKYYLYPTYSEDKHEFQIQLTDGIYSCQGKVPKDELEDLCNQGDMELEKYINLLKEALGIMKEASKFPIFFYIMANLLIYNRYASSEVWALAKPH